MVGPIDVVRSSPSVRATFNAQVILLRLLY